MVHKKISQARQGDSGGSQPGTTAVGSSGSSNLEAVVNRYDRQELIQGWDQKKLQDSKIAIVGTDMLANYTALCMAALGFGSIEIYGQGFVTDKILKNHDKRHDSPDYSSGFLYFDSCPGASRADALAAFLIKINPLISAYGVNIDLCKPGNIDIIGSPNIIIDTTNDPASKITVIEHARQYGISVISMSADAYSSGLGFYAPQRGGSRNAAVRKLIDNIVFAEYHGTKQGSTPSQVISALAVDEARKYVMPIGPEAVIDDIIVYNMASDKRFDYACNRLLAGKHDLSSKKAAMVGAGALGNFAGLDFVLNGIGELIIIDFDEVEATNLNRQVWFYDAVGRNKAQALAERLSMINPRVRIGYSKEKVSLGSDDFFRDVPLDLVVDTVDNNKARALINYYSMLYRIPFISGGTTFSSGQVTVCAPGETACLNCQSDIERLALEAHKPSESCIFAAQPSVITSNQIIGGLMVGEAKTLLQPEKYGAPVQYILKYVSGDKFRLASLPTQERCDCYNSKDLLAVWKNKMGHIYKE